MAKINMTEIGISNQLSAELLLSTSEAEHLLVSMAISSH